MDINGENTHSFSFSKSLYSKTALIKSAYSFTDIAYVHIDADEENFYVYLTQKDDNQVDYLSFENEMISQMTRLVIYEQTKDIRRLTIARALASTIVSNNETNSNEAEPVSIDEIMKNWFENG